MTDEEIPVLIVGGSLVGLTTAMLLGHHGVPSLSVERHAGTAIHPRAGHFQLRHDGDAAPARARGAGAREVAGDLQPDGRHHRRRVARRTRARHLRPGAQRGRRGVQPDACASSSTRTRSSRCCASARSSSARRCATAPRRSPLEQDDDGVTVTLRDLDSGDERDGARALRRRRGRQSQPDARAAGHRHARPRGALAQHHDLLPRRLRRAAARPQPGRDLRAQPASCAGSSGSTAAAATASSSSTRWATT